MPEVINHSLKCNAAAQLHSIETGKLIVSVGVLSVETDGYGPFIHSIGHSLGYLNTSFRVVKDQVLTVEPGIYVPGMGGVRIEDDVLITKTGMVNLTKIAPSKELIEV